MVDDWLTHSRQPLKRIKTERNWSEAPLELLSLILSKLFFKDRLNFKLVCRSWNSIVPNAPSLPLPMNSPFFHSPCLIIPQSTTNRWKIFHSVYNDFYYLDFPPELKHAEIRCSKEGWLLMSLRLELSPLFFFNPLTRERFELPPTSAPFYSVCFTSPPTSGDCFVFGIVRTYPGFATEFGLIKFGDEEWEIGPIVNRNPGQRFTHCPPLFFNGVFCCVNYTSRGLRIFDPKKNGGDRWIPNHNIVCLDGDEEVEMEDREIEYEYYIAEIDGEVCCVFVTNDDRKVSVRKWDFVRSRWKKVESLGGKCLFVSRTGMFAETCGVISGMENKIYFNKFCGKSGVLYSLATRMYHSVEGDFASRYAYGLIHADFGSWIKLSTL